VLAGFNWFRRDDGWGLENERMRGHLNSMSKRQRRPLILSEDTSTFATDMALLKSDKSVSWVDAIADQVKELWQSRNPQPADLLEDPSWDEMAASYGDQWVYFPWRRTAVRTLRPSDYAEVRINRNLHLITREQHDVLRTKKIAIAGLSVGASIASTLVLESSGGCMHLADFDALGLSNLNRLWGSICDLGINKAEIAARTVLELDPFLDVRVFPEGVTEENVAEFLEGVDVLLEECDNLVMKVRLREHAKRLGIPVIMQTSEGGLLDIERYDLDPDLPIFHGRLHGVEAKDLIGLTTREKAPYVMSILGVDEISPEFGASLVEIESSLRTWPQRGSAVVAGAAMAAVATRELLLDPKGLKVKSGRYQMDVARQALEPKPGRSSFAAKTPPRKRADPSVRLEEDVRDIVEAASRAPSAGNTQPWHFWGDSDRILITHHKERGRTTTDLGARAAWVAIGAAAESCVHAASRKQRRAEVRFVETPLPHVEVLLQPLGSAESTALSPYLEARATIRKKELPELGPLQVCTVFEAMPKPFLDLTPQKELAARIASFCDRARFLDPVLHREVMSEIVFDPNVAVESGISVRNLELSAGDATGIALLRRREVLDILNEQQRGFGLGRITSELLAGNGTILVPGFRGADTLASHFQLGRALMNFWLFATKASVAVYPLGFPYFAQRPSWEGVSASELKLLREAHDLFAPLIEPGVVYGPALRLCAAEPSREASLRSARLSIETIFTPLASGQMPW
jgi:molybdopterin/thiamine biosynthesis adenylyltransferase